MPPKVRDTEDTSVNDAARAQQDKADALPGAPNDGNSINWLGSSFSGVDIKVVAHLYGSVERDEGTESLRREAHTARRIGDACELAKSSSFDIMTMVLENQGGDENSDITMDANFLAIVGFGGANTPIDPEDVAAASFMLGLFHTLPFDTKFLTVWNSKFSQQADAHHTVADALDEKVAKLDDIREKSSSTITLATLQTLSLQTHREKFGVRALGTSYVKGYCRGPRTIAGSMVFTMFNEHALAKLIRAMAGKGSVYGERDADLATLIIDQLPPIDITVAIANEYGQLSQLGIYGLEFVNDGMTMSVEDILTEEVCQFVARDCDVLTAMGSVKLSQLQRGMHFNENGMSETSGTNLLFSSQTAYNEYLNRLKVRRRLNNR